MDSLGALSCLVRQLDSATSTVACWGRPFGPLFFRSLEAAHRYAIEVAEQSGLEGPWAPATVKDKQFLLDTWGDGVRYWLYDGMYTLRAKQ